MEIKTTMDQILAEHSIMIHSIGKNLDFSLDTIMNSLRKKKASLAWIGEIHDVRLVSDDRTFQIIYTKTPNPLDNNQIKRVRGKLALKIVDAIKDN